MRKLVTFISKTDGKAVRVLWSNGVCRTPDNLARVTATEGEFAWSGVKISGDNTLPGKLKFHPKTVNADDPSFLGVQNPPKVKPVMVETVAEDGTVTETEKVKKTRKAVSYTPEVLTQIKSLAEAGKTRMEVSTETGISYANLTNLAKKEGIEFVKGKKGRVKGTKIERAPKPVDAELLAKVGALALEGKTCREASAILDMRYASLYIFAKKHNVMFKAGVKGRKAGVKVEKVKKSKISFTKEQLEALSQQTIKEASVTLGVSYPTLYVAAKELGVTFKAGVRGRQKKVVDNPATV